MPDEGTQSAWEQPHPKSLLRDQTSVIPSGLGSVAKPINFIQIKMVK